MLYRPTQFRCSPEHATVFFLNYRTINRRKQLKHTQSWLHFLQVKPRDKMTTISALDVRAEEVIFFRGEEEDRLVEMGFHKNQEQISYCF